MNNIANYNEATHNMINYNFFTVANTVNNISDSIGNSIGGLVILSHILDEVGILIAHRI